jgi:hypothetical protein
MINSEGKLLNNKGNELSSPFFEGKSLKNELTTGLSRYDDVLTKSSSYPEAVLGKLGQDFRQLFEIPSAPIYDYKLESLIKEVKELKDGIEQLSKRQSATISTRIYNLPSKKYELKIPLDVTLEVYADEVLAVIPDLELYGEGRNQIEALNDLKLELIDLYENLEEMPDEELGVSLQAWKKTLRQLVKVCQ